MNTTPSAVSIKASDQLSHEVGQFCDLLARIYVRCLQEQDAQSLVRLNESISTHEEVKHAAA